MSKFLISFYCKNDDDRVTPMFGYDIAATPSEWVEDMRAFRNETNILLNALEISDEQAEDWDGELKGM